MSKPVTEEMDAPLDAVVLNEMQLLLAEKRTALATLRTGIAIFAFPLSLLSVLTSRPKTTSCTRSCTGCCRPSSSTAV